MSGTREYLAPEIIRAKLYESFYNPEQVDVFNIGIVMFIILFQTRPFIKGAFSDDTHYKLVIENNFEGFFSMYKRASEIPSEIL